MRFVFLFFVLLHLGVTAQNFYTISGTVSGGGGVLPGCHVHFGEVCIVTNGDGFFQLEKVRPGKVQLEFTFIGFQKKDTVIELKTHRNINIELQPQDQEIEQIDIKSGKNSLVGSHQNEAISSGFIIENHEGSLIKTLERLPGINSIDIGVQISKPVIRGLSFNRVVLAENNIKQENQQWGADHGMEIDAFAVENAEIIKGAAAVEFGSDAIGGVIVVSNNQLPTNKAISGEVILTGKSVNQLVGTSVLVEQRNNAFFYKVRGTLQRYADYHVPTDTILYLTQKIPVFHERLKNTAGQEIDFYSQFGFVTQRYKTVFTLSQVLQKSGFFPGAHGIPDVSKVADDGNRRNIGLPYQQVQHCKVLNNTKIYLAQGVLSADAGWQFNHRQELSNFHSHYPGQEQPAVHPDLELDFNLQTFTGNTKMEFNTWKKQKVVVGWQTQLGINRSGGYNFFLPEYEQFRWGGFFTDEWKVTENFTINGGIRFDQTKYHGRAFFDSLLYRYVLTLPGRDSAEAVQYAWRSQNIQRVFNGFTWHFGIQYQMNPHWNWQANLGKTFRNPTAVELGANGVHHGSYRFEQGNQNLKNEEGYYTDMNVHYTHRSLDFDVSGYGYYFTNFLYLQPTGELNHPIPDAGGIYYYKQSKALVSGIEISISKTFFNVLTGEANLEIPYNYLITTDNLLGYGIPYSPPVNGFWEIGYQVKKNLKASVNGKWAFKKDRSRGQGEDFTPGYSVYGLSVFYEPKIGKQVWQAGIQIQNLFDAPYFQSMSYYRKLNIPEVGRNVQVTFRIPFSTLVP